MQPGDPLVSNPANARYPARLTPVSNPASLTPVSSPANRRCRARLPQGIQPSNPHPGIQPGFPPGNLPGYPPESSEADPPQDPTRLSPGNLPGYPPESSRADPHPGTQPG